jgi:hypothetical protein
MLLRPGNAGSGTAADHVTVLDAALAQLPVPASKVIARTDSAGLSHGFPDACREDPHPGAQLTFTDIDGHRFQLMVTDLDDDDIAYLEALSRGRGRAERAICDAKDLGLANLPRPASPSTRHGSPSSAWRRTSSPGTATSPSTATSPEPNPNGSATASCMPPPSSSPAAGAAHSASPRAGPGPPISSPPSTGSTPSATPSPAASPAPAGVRRRRGRRRRRPGPVPVPEPPRRRPRAAPRAHRGGVNEPGVPTGAGRGHGSRRSSWLSRAACRSWWSRSARFGASRAASA